MMQSRRVMIIDSSVLVRRLLVEIINETPDLEVIGNVSSHAFALSKVTSTTPNAVIIDIDSLTLGGLALIAEIRHRFPTTVVIACGVERDRKARREVFAAGASDLITRPVCSLCRTSFRAMVQVPLLQALRRGPQPERPSVVPTEARSRFTGYPEVLVVGASTGGPNALSTLFQRLPRPEIPVVVVQHMPPVFTGQLAKRLSGDGAIKFVEVEDGMRAEPRRGYIAPGNFHVHLERDAKGLYLRLSQAALENSVRPSVDVLFWSAVETCANRVLGVVLTGMGQDGCRGCGEIRGKGGHVVVQDEASSVVWGMPRAVAIAGFADAVVPLSEMADELSLRLPFSRRTRTHTRIRTIRS